MYQFSRALVVKALNFLLVIAIVVALLGAVYDLNATIKSGGIDLRNRVVGARLLIQGKDPYYFRWQPGDPETLLDPRDKLELPVSRVTLPPTGLALYIPFANLSYFYQRCIWFVIQWGAFLLSLFLLLKRGVKTLRNRFLVGYSLFFLTSSMFWRLHLEVGQLYVFYVLLLGCSYWLQTSKIRFSEELSGLVIGLAAGLRFPILVMILPMILFKKFRFLAATIVGFTLCIAASIAVFGKQVWFSYFSAMKMIGQLSHGAIKVSHSPPDFAVPKVVEGMTFNLGSTPITNSSVSLLLDRFFDIHLPSPYMLAGLMLALLIYSLAIYRSQQQTERQSRLPAADAAFIFGGLMIIIIDLLMPVPRYNYNDIQVLIPLVLILKNTDFHDQQMLYLIFLLSIGFLMLSGLLPWLHHEILVGQFFTIFILILMSLQVKRVKAH